MKDIQGYTNVYSHPKVENGFGKKVGFLHTFFHLISLPSPLAITETPIFVDIIHKKIRIPSIPKSMVSSSPLLFGTLFYFIAAARRVSSIDPKPMVSSKFMVSSLIGAARRRCSPGITRSSRLDFMILSLGFLSAFLQQSRRLKEVPLNMETT